ncbi:Hemolysin-type calcium-binding protein [Marichromatium purpuratum 984]|uniref:Hemolysin-type calcium-binding protein n=1 Tax=Marichromatium purpuratum 984 TaxID=765910 RepID=W0E510_MARPU|nr:Hemolysin-type calcium-binding protein [Marichromatium purpuratum 984]
MSSEDFDSATFTTTNSTSTTFGDWTFTSSPNSTLALVKSTDAPFKLNQDGGAGDYCFVWNGGGAPNVSDFTLSSTDGTDFDLQSFDLGSSSGSSTTVTISGYRDNNEVVAGEVVDLTTGDSSGNITYSFTATDGGTSYGTLTFGAAFDRVDEIRFSFSATSTVEIDNIAIAQVSSNTAPVTTLPATPSIAEDSSANAIGGLSIADDDSDDQSVTLTASNGTIALTANGGATVTDNDGSDGTLAFNGTLAQVNAALGNLTFTPSADFAGNASLQVQTDDGNGGSDDDTLSITVTAVNDAPGFSAGATLGTVAEDSTDPAGATVSSLMGAVFTDTADSDALAGIVIGADAANGLSEGRWQYSTDNGSTWYDVGTVSTSAGLLLDTSAKLRFVPVADYNASPGALTVFAVDDSSATTFTSGSTRQTFDTTSDDATSRVSASGVALGTSISAVNDAPTVSAPGSALAHTEGTPLAIQGTGFSVSDPDAAAGTLTATLAAAEGTLSVAVGDSGASISSGNGSGTVILTGTLAQLDALFTGGGTGTIAYSAVDAPSASTTLTLTVNDGGNTGSDPGTSGDGASEQGSNSVTIDITATNDDPTLTGLPSDLDVSEDTASNLDLSAATFADADAGAGQVTLSLGVDAGTLAASSGGGVVIGGSGTTTLTLSGTAAAIDSYLDTASNIQYTSAADANGNDAATLTLSANDGGNTGSGGGTTVALGTANLDIADTPDITSATYDAATDQLVVTGNGFATGGGAGDDIDVSRLTLTGEGGATYTLATSADVDIDSATQFTVALSGMDVPNVEALLNQDGTTSATSTTSYALAADDDFNTHVSAGDTSDSAGVTVSNHAAPALSSATYDWSTGVLTLTGTSLVVASGATNDIDASTITLTGNGGASHTLTDTSDVEVSSATTANLTLSATDQLAVRGLLNKDGTQAGDTTTYNIAVADNWVTGAPTAADIADTTGNAVTVSNVAAPTITAASYDADTGVLTVTGSNFVAASGAANDVDLSTLTITGGNAASHTLTTATDVEIDSATQFSVTLSGTDRTAVAALLDQLGTSSSFGTTYNLAAADDWLTGADPGADISDTTGNAITVAVLPKLTSATYDAATGTLVVTGTNIQANGGGADIDASALTLTGAGGTSYTLTDTADVERTSATQFTLTLSATDRAGVGPLLNSNGTSSTGGTTYNLAAADDWNTAVSAGDSSDATGNGLTVSNVPTPTLTSATYDASNGTLVVTGSGLLARGGAANDIDASRLALVGEGGASHTLTDTADVELTSATGFTLTLSATDRAAVGPLLNQDGTSATGGTTYNLAAAEDWAAGAAAAVTDADLTGNAVTVANVPAPTITSATYDPTSGLLVVTATGLPSAAGAANDIDLSQLTFTGAGGATHTLTTTTDVEIDSATRFSATLGGTDKSAVDALLDQAGTQAADTTVYNLAAAEDWASGAAAAVTIADLTANPITVAAVSSGGGGGGSTPDTGDDLFSGDDGSTIDGSGIDTGLNPTTDFTDTTLDGAPVTTGTTTDRRTGESVAVVVSDPTAPGERTDVDPSSPEVDIPVGGVKVSKPESLGLIATSRVSTERSALETLTGGDDADADPEEAAGRAALIDSLESRATGGGVEVVQVTPVWPSEGGTGETPLRLTIDLGDGSGTDGRPTLVVVDTSALYDAAGNPLGPVEIVVAGAGTLVVRGPGSFRGDDGDTGADVDIVQGDGSAQVLFFGPDDDIIRGGGGDDIVSSAGGRDRLFGDGGDDRLDGGLGADILVGGSGNDQLAGGFGADTAQVAATMAELTLTRAADGSATLLGPTGTDTLGADVELLVSTADGAITLVQTFSAARQFTDGNAFDASFYLAENPDVAEAVAAGIFATAADHFQQWGMAEGRAPHALWDGEDYLADNPDVAAAVAAGTFASALEHYWSYGADENRAPGPWFDTAAYLAANPDVAAAGLDATSHFVLWGAAEGRLGTVADTELLLT